MLHATPSQCSTSVRDRTTSLYPTAQTSSEERADTPYRKLAVPPGRGISTTVHSIPSQCSTNAWSSVPDQEYPTAHTSLGDTAATPGFGTTDQLPEHPSPWPAPRAGGGEDTVIAVTNEAARMIAAGALARRRMGSLLPADASAGSKRRTSYPRSCAEGMPAGQGAVG